MSNLFSVLVKRAEEAGLCDAEQAMIERGHVAGYIQRIAHGRVYASLWTCPADASGVHAAAMEKEIGAALQRVQDAIDLDQKNQKDMLVLARKSAISEAAARAEEKLK